MSEPYPVSDDIPDEYLSDIEHNNLVWELVNERIESERGTWTLLTVEHRLTTRERRKRGLRATGHF